MEKLSEIQPLQNDLNELVTQFQLSDVNIIEQVVLDPNTIFLPNGWHRIMPVDNNSVIFFNELIVQENSHFIFDRSVTLNDQCNIVCTYIILLLTQNCFIRNWTRI